VLVLPHVYWSARDDCRVPGNMRHIKVLSKRRHVGKTARKVEEIPNQTKPGTVARNELDTHADTCCAGMNWRLLELTGEVCDVQPFLNSYDPVQSVVVGQCATVWTNEEDGKEYLLVGEQMLWFGDSLEHSLINPNQLRDYGLFVNDNPYAASESAGFGIDTYHHFIPFDSTGTIVHFETRVPTDWEVKNLPIILLTSDVWNPEEVNMQPGKATAEAQTMRSIYSLGTAPVRKISLANQGWSKAKIETNGEVERALGGISDTFDYNTFCKRLISAVNIGTHYRKDIVDEEEERKKRRKASSVHTADRHSKVTPEELARKWNIGLETAKATLNCTTQRGVRTAIHPMSRRVRVDHLDLHKPRLPGTWFVDGLVARVRSLSQNLYAYVYTQGRFVKAIPVTAKAEAGQTLIDFTDDVGIPERLVSDGAGEFTGRETEFVKHARRMRIKHHIAEQGRHNQNYAAEREIGTLSKRWKLSMRRKKVPQRLWDFGLVFESEILTRIARGKNKRSGYEEVTGQTPDISEWLDFGFYDLVWYWDRPDKPSINDETRKLARWLGVSHRVGSDLCYWLITESGKIISRTSVEHVTRDDYLEPDTEKKIKDFNTALEERLDDKNFKVEGNIGPNDWLLDIENEKYDLNYGAMATDGVTPTDEDYGDMLHDERPEADIFEEDPKMIDKYLGVEMKMDVGTGQERTGRVIKRARGPDGRVVGRHHSNPLFDTSLYEVQFGEGDIEKYTANVIAENMFAQVDDEGRQFLLLDEIVDHNKTAAAIPIADGQVRSPNGTMRAKITTRGWELLCQWKDGSFSWQPLKDLKEAYPLEVAEYAVANRLVEEPAFKWWVPFVLGHRNRVISKVKKKYWRTTHKFGIKLPHSVDEALEIDKLTGTDHWEKAIDKEMAKVKVAWKRKEGVTVEDVRKGKVKDMIGFQEIGCHMVFDVKMDFTRKARFVAGGHTTEAPSSVTYSSVVSRDSVRLAFTIAALNGLDLMACDLENAYLNAPCKEKIWFKGGRECGEDQGQVLVVVRALYGLKGSGNSWRNTLSHSLQDLGWKPTRADPDVYLREAVRDDGLKYYEMLLVYVDDILVLSHKPKEALERIGEFYNIKKGSLQEPDLYLGANVEKVQMPDGRFVWGTSPRDYVNNAITTVERLFEEDNEGYGLKKNVKNPFPPNYRPEVDVTRECGPELTSRYLQLIGILRWAVELGRVDIFQEVAVMSQYQANPREGHLEALYHIFAYMKAHKDWGKIAYDSKDPNIDESVFNNNADWKDFYGDVEEELPAKMPTPRGNSVTISAFVDANHAGNIVTRRSHTGIIIFVQNAPIIWFSKRQNTVESSTFGSEMVALRICKDLIVALRYKLRMFGVPINGPANVFCDNRGVVKNTSIPESTLLKKHNAINYHSVREAAAAMILRVGKEDGTTNLADVFTKTLPGEQRRQLCWYMMW
jgi:hypothetical protein